MTSLHFPTLDPARLQQVSPSVSPLPRPLSQGSHQAPEAMSYAQPVFRQAQGSLALPIPHHSFLGYPATAPPFPFQPFGNSFGQNMMRTVSHAHPMNSATDQNSSRYSISPHSVGEAPPSASEYPQIPFNFAERHVDPSVFNYSMSRSTSGGSDPADARLLTPHLDRHFALRPDSHNLPRFDFLAPPPHGSADRDVKPEGQETDYERQRAEQIIYNRRLLGDVGLGVSYTRAEQPRKVTKRTQEEQPSRVSSRIASMHRTSYADLDGQVSDESDEDDYEELQEEEFRPPKRTKGKRGTRQAYPKLRQVELSLYGLLQVYAQIPHLYPLFYYTLNNDLTINSESIPLIGSIPSTCTPLEKADSLRDFFHRGRRVLAQLDSFTTRCDRKYEGSMERWAEMDFYTKIAIRDVRRKVVERCENYKYTRRDILDKAVGKHKWQPIETGLVEWHLGGEGDPANDLHNVTLTLPTPPVYAPLPEGRVIRPFPSRARIAPAAVPAHTYPALYGEHQVPMAVQMPGEGPSAAS